MTIDQNHTWDGNEATADVAYRASEVVAIYPITPASPMGEHADAWAARSIKNLWGEVPQVVEMQSEGGAAGAVHGALQAGALTTSFTASQGLLLMIPNLYKIAGELTPAVLHVAARTIATHALSIFGDHSDVASVRGTGVALLASGSPQEAHDLAAVAHAATLQCRLPFVHFFDGFRTSHEIARVQRISDEHLRALLDPEALAAHRARALSPDAPVLRGTAQNPDVFFQAREAANPFYDAAPGIIQGVMDRFAGLTGRSYRLFDYVGHPEATRVVVAMGSACETAHETVDWLVARGERVGLLKVRLWRPFDPKALIAALPKTVRALAVLDRVKEPGAPADPLHLDVSYALQAARARGEDTPNPRVVGGLYGLSSKELSPAMLVSVFGELAQDAPRERFTVGIYDDVTHRALEWDHALDIEHEGTTRAVFYGLGSDGTVGANKNTIKILGEGTDLFAQGYFVYDSKKSGAVTVSHLRFGPKPIRTACLVGRASFVGVHQWGFLERFDVLERADKGAVLLVNSPHPPERVWDHLPREVQRGIIDKEIRLWTIDAYAVAEEAGMGRRINTVMQTCFFAISGVLPPQEALERIKGAIRKSYGRKGDELVARNIAAVDEALDALHRVPVPEEVTATTGRPPLVPDHAPDFVKKVTAVMMAGQGDLLPVSAFPPDGTWPTGTARWEKRAIAPTIPIWDADLCVQCNKCAMICPHAAIRVKIYPEGSLGDAPDGFKAVPARGPEWAGSLYTVQVAPEDCTGCTLCAVVCPAKDKSNPRHKSLDMEPMAAHREPERERWDHFLTLPEVDRSKLRARPADAQLLQPLFEFSGACSGCGETPYIKLLTQLFGDRALIANATGCSSIYGGNLPTTPYTVNAEGRGPAWSNSLFEDNAEFGLGFRLATDQLMSRARSLVRQLAGSLDSTLVDALLAADPPEELGWEERRTAITALRTALQGIDGAEAKELAATADWLVKKSVWIVGGDGWAYDIGYGGLDHVLASGRDVNILVLDTEVYSNTGGQASKATPLGAVAKFAASGKGVGKKDLGMLAMAYGHVYVAQVAMGAKDMQTWRAFTEAESYPGPSLIIAYSHCIAHGYDLAQGTVQQTAAVNSGYWPLYRFDPRRAEAGEPPLKLDSREPRLPLADFAWKEARFRMLLKSDPDRARELLARAQRDIQERFTRYEELSKLGGAEDGAER